MLAFSGRNACVARGQTLRDAGSCHCGSMTTKLHDQHQRRKRGGRQGSIARERDDTWWAHRCVHASSGASMLLPEHPKCKEHSVRAPQRRSAAASSARASPALAQRQHRARPPGAYELVGRRCRAEAQMARASARLRATSAGVGSRGSARGQSPTRHPFRAPPLERLSRIAPRCQGDCARRAPSSLLPRAHPCPTPASSSSFRNPRRPTTS